MAADNRLQEARRQAAAAHQLDASTGTASNELSNLLNGDFSVWNLLTNLSQPLLQGDRLSAGVDLAKSASTLRWQPILRASY